MIPPIRLPARFKVKTVNEKATASADVIPHEEANMTKTLSRMPIPLNDNGRRIAKYNSGTKSSKSVSFTGS